MQEKRQKGLLLEFTSIVHQQQNINSTKNNSFNSLFVVNNRKVQEQSQVSRSALLLVRRIGEVTVRINCTVSHHAIMCEFFLHTLAGLVTPAVLASCTVLRSKRKKKVKF